MYRMASNGWLKHWDFLILDLICLEISYLSAYFIRHGIQNPFLNAIYRNMFFIILFLQITVVFFFETFKDVLRRGYYIEFTRTMKQVMLVSLLWSFYLVVTQEAESYSRTVLGLTAVFYLLTAYLTRIIWKNFIKKRSLTGKGSRSLLIITTKALLSTVLDDIKSNYDDIQIAGVVLADADFSGKTINEVKIVADYDNAADYVCREWIDEVFFNVPADLSRCEELISKFMEMGVTVHLKLTKATDIFGKNQYVEQLGSYVVLTTSVNLVTSKQLFYKRFFDICGGLMGCLLTAILFVFIGPVIYMKSPGPVFFSQIRVGKNGKKFKMYKFRSMYMDAEKRKQEMMEKNRVSGGLMFKIDNDPRIIGSEKGPGKGIGNFIRKNSIDEFPQFWNVLKGDMSLVGTRPPTVDEWEKYELRHRARLAIKPGITGMWQVSGRSDITDFEEVVKLDTEYIRNWNIGLDIKILLKTVGVVVKGQGSM